MEKPGDQNDLTAIVDGRKTSANMVPLTAEPRSGHAISQTLLENNVITIAWAVCYVANYFTFPMYQMIEKRHGVGRHEVIVMFCLAHLGPLNAQDICVLAGRPKNSISDAVHKLLSKKRIARQADPADRRRAVLSMTKAGHALFEKLSPIFEKRETQMADVLTARERQQFAAILTKLTNAVPDWAYHFDPE